MSLVRLACPHCGSPLPASPGAVLFACASCGRAAQLAPGRLIGTEAWLVPPRHDPGTGRVLRYPCWVFPVAWTDDAPALPASDGASTRPGAGLPDRCAVPSLAPEPGGAFLRLARALTLTASGWDAAPAAVRDGRDGPLGASDAARLVPTVLLACAVSVHRQRLLDLDPLPLRLGPPALLWLPAARSGRRLLDLVAGVEVSDRLLGESAATAPSAAAQELARPSDSRTSPAPTAAPPPPEPVLPGAER